MEKKKYEKPIILDLNGNTVSGGPLSCIPGASASGSNETCVGGTSAGQGCVSGISAAGACDNGPSGTSSGCNAGPSNV